MKTVKKECEIEFEEKKSKFIGYIKPVFSKEEAEEFIRKIKNKHSDATHNCSTYKINIDGKEYYKADDDGEPSGTAGKPMGDILNYMGVTNLVVVATRYFGGIKLGAGGLVRAYAKTAKLAVIESGIVAFVEKINLIFEIPYEKISDLEELLREFEAEIFEKSFLERAIYKIRVKKDFINAVQSLSYLNIIS
ncbi:MAG: YigZ family protein [Fusobacterium sp.]|uniref:IMPACT family protein n=1 Tax=Fusobacterium sp. TaxID=68766 RepID=UPI0026DD9316|nr:YigZ family protein [Fusobacterium sp.]MDO4690041.1 YigZ family protein [Fusobacterium sp.]